MPTDPTSSFPTPVAESSEGQLLIPFNKRLQFIVFFILITGLGYLVGRAISRTLTAQFDSIAFQHNKIYWAYESLQHNEVSGSFFNAAIEGAIIGIGQWFLLRRYLPSWLWIVANSIGNGFSVFMLTLWNIWFIPVFLGIIEKPEGSNISIYLLTIISVTVSCFCFALLGLAQLLALRQKLRASWRWAFVPVLGIFISKILLLPFNFVQYHSYVWLAFLFHVLINPVVIGASLGATEAISLSTLSRKASKINPSSDLTTDSFLTLVPEITDSRQIKILSQKLFSQINQAWKTETTSVQELIYLVAMAKDGSIVAYQPINQAAVDYINQTPLADLVDTSSFPSPDGTYQEPLARFQVLFIPPGSIKIRSWRAK